MDVFLFFVLVSFLNLTACVEVTRDDADVVDPTGWDYDRVTKGSRRYDCVVDPSGWEYDRDSRCPNSTNNKNEDILACEDMLSKCKAEIAYFQLKSVAAVPADANSQANMSAQDSHSSSSVFIRRFISLLLDSAGLLDDEKLSSGDIEIKISPPQLKKLIEYSSSRFNMSLRELDSILTDIIHKKPSITDSFSWKDVIYSAIVQKEVWLYLSILCIVLTFCRIILTVRTVSGVAKLAIFALCIVSYLIEYLKMYKAVEIRQRAYLQTHPDVPDSCNPKKQNLLYNMFEGLFSFKKDECETYYKELWSEPFMEVSPLCVLSSIVTDFVLHPTAKIGNAIVVFSSVILGELPLQYGWFIYLMSCFGVFVIMALALIILTGGSMRLGGLLGGLEVSQNRRQIASASNNQSEPRTIQSAPAVADEQNTQRKTSASSTQLLLETVGKSDSFVLMDATALHTILKGSLTQHRNEIEELSQATTAALCEPKPKEKTPEASSCSGGCHLPLKSDPNSGFVTECDLIDFNDDELNPDTCVENGSRSSEDLFPACDVVEPITSKEKSEFGSPDSDKREITTVG